MKWNFKKSKILYNEVQQMVVDLKNSVSLWEVPLVLLMVQQSFEEIGSAIHARSLTYSHVHLFSHFIYFIVPIYLYR